MKDQNVCNDVKQFNFPVRRRQRQTILPHIARITIRDQNVFDDVKLLDVANRRKRSGRRKTTKY